MSTELLIVIGLLAAGALYLVFYLRALIKRSEREWREADKSKLREWEDDDDWK